MPKRPPSCKSCASWPSCFRQQKRARGLLRSYRTLSSCSCCLYRHSGPIGPGVHPVHPAHPANPASDEEKARRRTGPRPTVARAARLLNRSARACPSQGYEKNATVVQTGAPYCCSGNGARMSYRPSTNTGNAPPSTSRSNGFGRVVNGKVTTF